MEKTTVWKRQAVAGKCNNVGLHGGIAEKAIQHPRITVRSSMRKKYTRDNLRCQKLSIRRRGRCEYLHLLGFTGGGLDPRKRVSNVGKRAEAAANIGADATPSVCESSGYQPAPEASRALLNAAYAPEAITSPDGRRVLLASTETFQAMHDLAATEISIAGFRLNPSTNSASRLPGPHRSLKLFDTETGETAQIGIPEIKPNEAVYTPLFSPDGNYIACVGGGRIHVVEVNSLSVRILPFTETYSVCHLFGWAIKWSPDSKSIFFRTPNPKRASSAPTRPSIPTGPNCLESIPEPQDKAAKKSAKGDRTYQDLLTDEYDAQAFEYYCDTSLALANINGEGTLLPIRGIITDVNPSPSGTYILVKRITRPFSYFLPYHRFPEIIDVFLTSTGDLHKHLASLPLASAIPIAMDAAREGPRSWGWLGDHDTLYWAECQDKGDPRDPGVDGIRDVVFALPAPFEDTPPQVLATFKYRFGRVALQFDVQMRYVVVAEHWWKTRQTVRTLVPLDEAGNAVPGAARIIWERDFDDRYGDPGDLVCKRYKGASWIERFDEVDENVVFLNGKGASSTGDRDFLDRYHILTHEKSRLWQSEDPLRETFTAFLDKDHILIQRQSLTQPAEYYIVRLADRKDMAQVTLNPHPCPQLNDMKSELIKYTRTTDGLPLSGYLYLPSGYDKDRDGPLPTLLWAYPKEFVSEKSASQTRGSPFMFPFTAYRTPLYFVMQGYAVLDKVQMPIVSPDASVEPNDTYIEQLVANAESAINILVEMGVTDRERVAVGGHSYGAFMTMNLLAHSNLFAAGVARSGAYNRTLTPNGFQAEERTLWQVPDLYMRMSPYMNAHKITTPCLLIHGGKDNNSGTHLIQSERMFSALKGHGRAPARLVVLPLEQHAYKTLESNGHVLYEMTKWLDMYCRTKGRPLVEAVSGETAKTVQFVQKTVVTTSKTVSRPNGTKKTETTTRTEIKSVESSKL
ncbi:hypothetical protein BC830DRAFT_1094735 [Chytriomyces sp. MP71]|nr:hypothetical protein BC830DRAFT_1094735 [Chytriomyces sp. MP71]